MSEVVINSTSKMSDADVRAIAVYLPGNANLQSADPSFEGITGFQHYGVATLARNIRARQPLSPRLLGKPNGGTHSWHTNPIRTILTAPA
ncbi:hypothetical protein V1278_003931 [Bradyrhizobium sp. AZCC 1577]